LFPTAAPVVGESYVTMWVVGAAAVWLVGASGTALLLGAVLRRCGAAAVPLPVAEPVTVPAQRAASTATPPSGLRSQAHLSCAGARAGR
jgi:hypothetical protein